MTNETQPQTAAASELPVTMSHPSIICGHVRLVWADPFRKLPAGWALPGGGRVTDEAEARLIARSLFESSPAQRTSK